jgi:hypothetical protein
MSYTLDAVHAEFIARPHASLAVASRDANNVPSLFKVAACRVSPDRKRVTLYVDQQLAATVLRDLRAGHPIAAIFTEPSTHRSIQLKGERADIGPATPADREYARERIESVVAHLGALKYPEAGVRCYFHFAPERLVAVSFTPTAAFEQTPGPSAGARLSR